MWCIGLNKKNSMLSNSQRLVESYVQPFNLTEKIYSTM